MHNQTPTVRSGSAIPHLVYIALGSNIGDRNDHLSAAICRIGELPQTLIHKQSSFHNTKPIGGPPGQDDYLNAVIEISTDFHPTELLANLLYIEKQMGRNRASEPRYGPRIIDLDILLFDQLICDDPGLTIPHPRMTARPFVLIPLAEIAPDSRHPVLKVSARTLLTQTIP